MKWLLITAALFVGCIVVCKSPNWSEGSKPSVDNAPVLPRSKQVVSYREVVVTDPDGTCRTITVPVYAPVEEAVSSERMQKMPRPPAGGTDGAVAAWAVDSGSWNGGACCSWSSKVAPGWSDRDFRLVRQVRFMAN